MVFLIDCYTSTSSRYIVKKGNQEQHAHQAPGYLSSLPCRTCLNFSITLQGLFSCVNTFGTLVERLKKLPLSVHYRELHSEELCQCVKNKGMTQPTNY